MDTAHLPSVTRAVGGISLELLEYQHLPTGPDGASLCRACVPWSGAGLGRHPSAPLMAVSTLSPAATLKSKQDELHRKALQTLER